MFEFDRDRDDSFTIKITGPPLEAVEEIKNILELDDKWPIFPLMFDRFYKACKIHEETEEEMREVVMLDSGEKRGIFLFDIEQLKIEAKQMQIKGLKEE